MESAMKQQVNEITRAQEPWEIELLEGSFREGVLGIISCQDSNSLNNSSMFKTTECNSSYEEGQCSKVHSSKNNNNSSSISSFYFEKNIKDVSAKSSMGEHYNNGNLTIKNERSSNSSVQVSAYEKKNTSYLKQWINGFTPMVLIASCIAFILDLVWAISLGSWLYVVTNHKMGTSEVVFSSLICGSGFTIFGRQPTLVVRLSVPSLVFVNAVSITADRLSLELLPWMGWIAISGGTFLVMVAVIKPSVLTMSQQLNQFSWEISQIFVSLCLIWHAMENILLLVKNSHPTVSSMFSLWLCTCSFLLGVLADMSRHLRGMPWKLRKIMADYGPAFIILALVGLSQFPKWSNVNMARVEIANFGHHANGTSLAFFKSLKNLPLWAVLLSFIPGALLACLVLIDLCSHCNIISLKSETQVITWTRRDLITLAGGLILCGILGLPPCFGLFQQIKPSDLKIKYTSISDIESQEVFTHETSEEDMGAGRVCGFISSVLLGVPLLPKVLLLVRRIPQPLLWGFCLQVSVHKLSKLWMGHSVRRNTSQNKSSLANIIYTAIQTVCIAAIFSVSKTEAALLFPLFFLTTLWLRHFVISRVFEKNSVRASKQPQHPSEAYGNSDSFKWVNPSYEHTESERENSKAKKMWAMGKRKRNLSTDVGLSSVSSSLRFVRVATKKRRSKASMCKSDKGEDSSEMDVHSNFLYDPFFQWLDCMDPGVVDEAIVLRGRVSFEDWAKNSSVTSHSQPHSASFNSIS